MPIRQRFRWMPLLPRPRFRIRWQMLEMSSIFSSVAAPIPESWSLPDLVEQQLPYGLHVIENMGLVLSKVEHEQYPQVPPNTILQSDSQTRSAD